MGIVGQRFLGLCLPPLAFCALDGTMTLAGQSGDYWAGSYFAVNEASPTFNHLLGIHPAAFAAGLLVWAAVAVGLVLLLPDTLALIVSIAVTFGHTVGTATWLLFHFQYGYQICNGLFLLSAVALGLGIRFNWPSAPGRQDPFANWHPAVRWSLAAGLFSLGVYLFVWPRTI
jgi:hypothetical protein